MSTTRSIWEATKHNRALLPHLWLVAPSPPPGSWGSKWKQEEKGVEQEPGSERQGEAAAPSRYLRIYLSPASQTAARPVGIIPKHSPPKSTLT